MYQGTVHDDEIEGSFLVGGNGEEVGDFKMWRMKAPHTQCGQTLYRCCFILALLQVPTKSDVDRKTSTMTAALSSASTAAATTVVARRYGDCWLSRRVLNLHTKSA